MVHLWLPTSQKCTRSRPLLAAPGCPKRFRATYRCAAWQAGHVSIGAELTAVSTTLDELAKRVSTMLSSLSPADEERYGSGLLEVERTLGAASRRLERMVTAER